MTNAWLPILQKLKLSRAEQSAVKRYEQDPEGRGFLPIADILRTHKRIDESIELLIQGVTQHPTFTVARVVLSRELFGKGLMGQAWTTLMESPISLDDNVLAQKLKFKLALLFEDEVSARKTYDHIQRFSMLDDEVVELGDMLKTASLSACRQTLLNTLKVNGIIPVLPDRATLGEGMEIAGGGQSGGIGETSEDSLLDVNDPRLDEALYQYQVVPLSEVFKGRNDKADPKVGRDGLELDSTTLAELYCKQGHFTRALGIYRRLAQLTPGNEYLRHKMREVTKLEREQRSHDIAIDPSLVDQMESLEIIDRQSHFYGDLLKKLES